MLAHADGDGETSPLQELLAHDDGALLGLLHCDAATVVDSATLPELQPVALLHDDGDELTQLLCDALKHGVTVSLASLLREPLEHALALREPPRDAVDVVLGAPEGDTHALTDAEGVVVAD